MLRKKYWWPIHPFPSPNMNAKPKAQNSKPQSAVSTMHSSKMFDVSRVRREARFEHHEAGLHEEHEERGHQHPDGVHRVHEI